MPLWYKKVCFLENSLIFNSGFNVMNLENYKTDTKIFFPVFTVYLKEIEKSILISTTYIKTASLLCVFNLLTQPIFSS